MRDPEAHLVLVGLFSLLDSTFTLLDVVLCACLFLSSSLELAFILDLYMSVHGMRSGSPAD